MMVTELLRKWLRTTTMQDHLPELEPGVVAGDADPLRLATALLTVARDGDPATRTAALDALGEIPARSWAALDEALRQRWGWAPRLSRDLAAEVAGGNADPLRLVVAGCHHDGRIREVAVARLAGQRHPAAVAVLALRACDWVAQVRLAARTAVTAWPSPPDGPALTVLAGLAIALSARRAGGWLTDRVDEMLRDLPVARLETLLSAGDPRVRRKAYRAAIAGGRLAQQRLTEAAVREQDLLIRVMCARVAVAAADHDQLLALLNSRTSVVRAEALRALIERGDRAVAEPALTDRHPSVREIAQSAVRREGADPSDHYRRLAAREAPEPSVLAGLGETGRPDDGRVVMRSLSHPRVRGRVEAIRALRRWGITRPDLLVPLLRDESPAVTRQAVATLRRSTGDVDPADLWALLSRGNPPHVRFAGYRLLISGDAWQRLATDLRLVEDADPRLRSSSRADLAAWLDREAATTFRGPGRDRAAELDELIEQARPALGDDKIRLLRFHAGL